MRREEAVHAVVLLDPGDLRSEDASGGLLREPEHPAQARQLAVDRGVLRLLVARRTTSCWRRARVSRARPLRMRTSDNRDPRTGTSMGARQEFALNPQPTARAR